MPLTEKQTEELATLLRSLYAEGELERQIVTWFGRNVYDTLVVTLTSYTDKASKLVRGLIARGEAVTLLRAVKQDRPRREDAQAAIDGMLCGLLAAPPAPGSAVDRCAFEELFVLDRQPLRDKLKELAQPASRPKVLLVRGEPRSGKSHGKHLFELLALENGATPVYSCANVLANVDQLVHLLFATLGASEAIPPRYSTPDSWYKTVCFELLSQVVKHKRPLWIAIDDLSLYKTGDSLLKDEIQGFCEQFALNMMLVPEFPRWFRLMLIDYPAQVPAKWQPGYWREDHTSEADVKAEHVGAMLAELAASGTALMIEGQRDLLAAELVAAADAPPTDPTDERPRLERLHRAISSVLPSITSRAETMAILNALEPLYQFSTFSAAARKAALGTVGVSLAEGGPTPSLYRVTGWLITDDLVALPEYGVGTEVGYLCRLFADPANPEAVPAETIEATMLAAPRGAEPDLSRLALLRLARPVPGRALSLSPHSARVGSPLFVFQLPEGNPELHFSVGNVRKVEEPWLYYDANTVFGSSGAPLLDATLRVVGMHSRAVTEPGRGTPESNAGPSLAALLAVLREMPQWEEIARHHNLADIRPALEALKAGTRPESPPADRSLLWAAVRWSIDPRSVPLEDLDRLRALVNDPIAPRWTFRAGERERLLRSAGSLDALRAARGDEEIDEAGQRVLDRILSGPPYPIEDADDEELPYWLQAVRWFAGVAPSLPEAALVGRLLERRRVRGTLRGVAGLDFRGRDRELARLLEWYKDPDKGPMVLTGIGGIGKSALLARFALSLPEETLLLWLDFDRADLAADDAVSVLRSLFEQTAAQRDGVAMPAITGDAWGEAAATFGALLAGSETDFSPLLVLDGFEVAQHAEQHEEIWGVLGAILERAPSLRTVVSGRAPVAGLRLRDRPAEPLPLAGMAREDAEAWLIAHGVTDAAVLSRLLDACAGVPLKLRLAVRWLEVEGAKADLAALPQVFVEGFLYRRILDRVIDARLKPCAAAALVVRRLTADMIPEVLGADVPEELTPQEVFALLSREMALFGKEAEVLSSAGLSVVLAGEDVLRLRPEIRTAALRLLEFENPDQVRGIDERAAAWYARQPDDPAVSAELVYHRLRLGDLAGAKAAWREDSALLLLHAQDDLPEGTADARAWLQARTEGTGTGLAAWEAEAAIRIRDALERGLLRVIPAILAEHEERGPASPVVLYDAWWRWREGDLSGARALLQVRGRIDGPVARDRAALRALLAALAGDRPEAERWLAAIEGEELWHDRPELATVAPLAVRAARIRLTVDLKTEQMLSATRWLRQVPVDATGRYHRRLLTPSDVLLPSLMWQMPGGQGFEAAGGARTDIPVQLPQLPGFARRVEAKWPAIQGPDGLGLWSTDPTLQFPRVSGVGEPVAWQGPWRTDDLPAARLAPIVGPHALYLLLAILSRRRWRLVTTSLFFAHACELALRRDESSDPLALSVIGTLAAFIGDPRDNLYCGGLSLDTFPQLAATTESLVPPPIPDRARRANQIISSEGFGTGIPESGHLMTFPTDPAFHTDEPADRALRLYLFGPDPLEMLARRALGVPDTLPLLPEPQGEPGGA